jgi:integrase
MLDLFCRDRGTVRADVFTGLPTIKPQSFTKVKGFFNRYVDKRRDEGASNATISREMAALRRIFNTARATTPPKVRVVPVFPHLTENTPRQGFVEDQKYAKLARHAEELWLKAILATAYTFGLRKSELLLNMKVRPDRSGAPHYPAAHGHNTEQ